MKKRSLKPTRNRDGQVLGCVEYVQGAVRVYELENGKKILRGIFGSVEEVRRMWKARAQSE